MIALELIFVVNVAQKACFLIFFNLRGPYLTPFISFCFTSYDDVCELVGWFSQRKVYVRKLVLCGNYLNCLHCLHSRRIQVHFCR